MSKKILFLIFIGPATFLTLFLLNPPQDIVQEIWLPANALVSTKTGTIKRLVESCNVELKEIQQLRSQEGMVLTIDETRRTLTYELPKGDIILVARQHRPVYESFFISITGIEHQGSNRIILHTERDMVEIICTSVIIFFLCLIAMMTYYIEVVSKKY